jgi:hypothetical protein
MLRDPFTAEDEASLYVPRPASERALASLEEGLRGGTELVLLSGPVGIGKSLLLKVLARKLEATTCCVTLEYDGLSTSEICQWVLRELDARETLAAERAMTHRPTLLKFREWMQREKSYADGDDPLRGILNVGRDMAAKGLPLVILIDDAEGMKPAVAHELGTLVRGAQGTVSMALAATPDDPSADALADTLGIDATRVVYDTPMTLDETIRYVSERLGRTEATQELRACLNESRIRRLYRYTQGNPRRLHGELGLIHLELSRVRAGVPARTPVPPSGSTPARPAPSPTSPAPIAPPTETQTAEATPAPDAATVPPATAVATPLPRALPETKPDARERDPAELAAEAAVAATREPARAVEAVESAAAMPAAAAIELALEPEPDLELPPNFDDLEVETAFVDAVVAAPGTVVADREGGAPERDPSEPARIFVSAPTLEEADATVEPEYTAPALDETSAEPMPLDARAADSEAEDPSTSDLDIEPAEPCTALEAVPLHADESTQVPAATVPAIAPAAQAPGARGERSPAATSSHAATGAAQRPTQGTEVEEATWDIAPPAAAKTEAGGAPSHWVARGAGVGSNVRPRWGRAAGIAVVAGLAVASAVAYALLRAPDGDSAGAPAQGALPEVGSASRAATPREAPALPAASPRENAVPPPAAAAPSASSAPPARDPLAPPPAIVETNIQAIPFATVMIDGRSVGDTPLAKIPLESGTHTFRVKMHDGRIIEEEIEISETNRYIVFK